MTEYPLEVLNARIDARIQCNITLEASQVYDDVSELYDSIEENILRLKLLKGNTKLSAETERERKYLLKQYKKALKLIAKLEEVLD